VGLIYRGLRALQPPCSVTDQAVTDPCRTEQPDLSRLARFQLLRPYLRQLVLEEAMAGIVLDAEELGQAQLQFLQDNRLDGEEQLTRYCQYHGLSISDCEHRIAQPARLWKFGQQQFGARAESHFLARKQSLDKVVYSLLRNKDSGLIRELYLQVREGEADFADLAAEHAEGPERTTRGIVGPVPLNQGHPDLVERLTSAPIGVLLDPFPIEDWWLLVRVESHVPATFGPEVAEAMIQELLEAWLEGQVDQRIKALGAIPTQPAR
jgi:parvulin-like peptidyl-prolyl isomerase